MASAARISRFGTSCGSACTTTDAGPASLPPLLSSRPVRTPWPLAQM
jgi:hypothetical protein